jgi:hypothetical protein
VTGGWALHFGRTAGGRRLRDDLGGAALAEMSARRAAGLDPAAVRAHQVMADAVRAGERDRGPYRARVVRPAVAGDGASPRKRDLEGGSKGLSGASYVVGELDTSHRGADGKLVPGLCRAAIPVRTVNRCDHCETVCARCAEVWMYDWKFYFDRTIGGRRLREGLGGLLARPRRPRDPRPVPGQAEGGTVKTRFDKIGYPLYCDAGPHEGDTRIDLTISLYLSPQEYASYQGPESLRITLGEPGSEHAGAGTAEPSRDRPAVDARPPDHPLPAPAAPGEPASHSASTAKEHSDGRP